MRFRQCFSAVLAFAAAFLAIAGARPARADDDTTPMRFTVVAAGSTCDGCVVINARGEITDDTARDFALFLAENRLQGILAKEPKRGAPRDPSAARVMVAFESIGGKVVPALIVGRRIRQLGWTTVVGQARLARSGVVFDSAGCYSACSMVMLGGVERYVVPGSKPGIHQFSPQFKDEENFTADEMNAIVRDYARQVTGVFDYVHDMGVDMSFFIATMRTPFTGMDVLKPDRWTALGLATGRLPDAEETGVAAILGAAGAGAMASAPAAASPTAPPPADAAPAATSEPASASGTATPPAGWSVGNETATFADGAISLSLACLRPDAARLELTFKALDPIDLEHIRAAAFAVKRLGLGERQIAIASVAAPGPGEQGLAALLDLRDLKALQATSSALTFTVLDRSGKPAAHAASVPSVGAAKAISDAMARCGGA
jgi:hypothetical protein